MKAKCAECGKRTSIDADLLGENEEARHFDCVPDVELDPERISKLLAMAGLSRKGIEVHDGEGRPPSGSSPRRKIPVVTGEQLAISSSGGGNFSVTRKTA